MTTITRPQSSSRMPGLRVVVVAARAARRGAPSTSATGISAAPPGLASPWCSLRWSTRGAAAHLGVERGVVGVAAVLPVEGEAEVVDVELDGLGAVEDPQDRDGRALRRCGRRVGGWAGGEGVPVADAVLVGDELEGLAVAERDVAGGQVGAQPTGHGLGIGHDAASLRRTAAAAATGACVAWRVRPVRAHHGQVVVLRGIHRPGLPGAGGRLPWPRPA